jgi:ribose-phosphate pyrophosphokinase
MTLLYEFVCLLRNEVLVIAGPSSAVLAKNIAEYLHAKLIPVDVRVFTDGEIKIRIDGVRKKYCVIVQSTYPPTDRHLLEALMMIKKCDDDQATDICTVIPYMAYARQDRAFIKGEVVTMELIAKLFETAGARRIITVDIHSARALSYFTIDVLNISAIPLLAKYVRDNIKLKNPVVVSPDAGGLKRAEEFGRILGIDVMKLNKCRDRKTGLVYINEDLSYSVNGRDVILVDDMISSGCSILKACQVLKKNKSGRLYAICSHALLIGDAANKIRAAGIREIIATNSIPNKWAKVDISSTISKSLLNLIHVND